jgi:RNA polymerase sigma-70 factor (ECF subfamily)
VDVPGEAVVETSLPSVKVDLESLFDAQYERIARVIKGVIRDPARAEELAVEVFLKWSQRPEAHGENAEAWLYRTAIRVGLDELRKRMRRHRYERLFDFVRRSPSPHEVFVAKEEERRVQTVLACMNLREVELVLLRSYGHSYDELALALDLNPASIGTLLARAQKTFRKEYSRRYGPQ